jgi:hypothetical protein
MIAFLKNTPSALLENTRRGRFSKGKRKPLLLTGLSGCSEAPPPPLHYRDAHPPAAAATAGSFAAGTFTFGSGGWS